MPNKISLKIGFTFAFLFTFAICTTPLFALTINQDTSTGDFQIQYFEPTGQSFTATDTDIGSVGIWIEPYNQNLNDLTLTMSLYSGAGDFSNSALLTMNTFTLVLNYNDWLDLDVSTTSFTQDAVYTIGIFNDTAQWGAAGNWSEDPYSGGVAFTKGLEQLDGDLKFRVGPGNISPVPEPATMLLLGTGLVGLAGFGRKKFFKK